MKQPDQCSICFETVELVFLICNVEPYPEISGTNRLANSNSPLSIHAIHTIQPSVEVHKSKVKVPARDQQKYMATHGYWKSLPTYFTTCHHYVHMKCFLSVVGQPGRSFKCPQCKTPSNVLLPVVWDIVTNGGWVEVYEELGRKDAMMEVFSFTEKPISMSIYMAKYILNNIDVLEKRSRLNLKDTLSMTNEKLQSELVSLSLLFKAIKMNEDIKACKYHHLPIGSAPLSTTDPFVSGVVSSLWSKFSIDFTLEAYQQFVFQLIILYVYNTYGGEYQSKERVIEIINQLKSNQISLEQHLVDPLNNDYMNGRLIVFLKKMCMFQFVWTNDGVTYIGEPYDQLITVENINSLEWLQKTLKLDTLKQHIVQFNFDPLLENYYETLPSTDMFGIFPNPESIFDFIQNESNYKLKKELPPQDNGEDEDDTSDEDYSEEYEYEDDDDDEEYDEDEYDDEDYDDEDDVDYEEDDDDEEYDEDEYDDEDDEHTDNTDHNRSVIINGEDQEDDDDDNDDDDDI